MSRCIDIENKGISAVGDRCRSEATVRFTIQKCKLAVDYTDIYSPVFFVKNFKWRLILQRRKLSLGYHLEFCRENYEQFTQRTCHVKAALRLIISSSEMIQKDIVLTFHNNKNIAGYNEFIDWKRLTDSLSDDELELEVHMIADQPTNMTKKISHIRTVPATNALRQEFIGPNPICLKEDIATAKEANVVPDKILDKLICHLCHRFLSVQPVRIYSDGQILCGRCSKNDKSGTVSLFGLVADNCLFKCINRFDGCRKLLAYSMSEKHEMNCESRRYTCPLCASNTEIPTFRLMRHFTENHKTNILEVPHIVVDLESSLDKLFLYKKHNTLFFVKVRKTTENLMLNIVFLGLPDDERGIRQKLFVLKNVDSEILVESEEKECLAYDSIDECAFSIPLTMNITGEKRIVLVKFQLTAVKYAELVSIPQTSTKYNINSDLYKLESKTEEYINVPRCFFIPLSYTKTLSQDLDSEYLLKTNSNGSIKIKLSCYNCSLLDYSLSIDNDEKIIFIKDTQSESIHHMICYYCHSYITEKNIEFSEVIDILPTSTVAEISYFCKWKCGYRFKHLDIDRHEMQCKIQPPRDCPIKYCIYRGNLSNYENHFKYIHSLHYVELRAGLILKIKLSAEQSPLKIILGVSHTFIALELRWVHPSWSIIIYPCELLHNMQPKALLFDSEDGFLTEVDCGKETIIHHIETLKVKCYLTASAEPQLFATS